MITIVVDGERRLVVDTTNDLRIEVDGATRLEVINVYNLLSRSSAPPLGIPPVPSNLPVVFTGPPRKQLTAKELRNGTPPPPFVDGLPVMNVKVDETREKYEAIVRSIWPRLSGSDWVKSGDIVAWAMEEFPEAERTKVVQAMGWLLKMLVRDGYVESKPLSASGQGVYKKYRGIVSDGKEGMKGG